MLFSRQPLSIDMTAVDSLVGLNHTDTLTAAYCMSHSRANQTLHMSGGTDGQGNGVHPLDAAF